MHMNQCGGGWPIGKCSCAVGMAVNQQTRLGHLPFRSLTPPLCRVFLQCSLNRAVACSEAAPITATPTLSAMARCPAALQSDGEGVPPFTPACQLYAWVWHRPCRFLMLMTRSDKEQI